MAEKDSRSFLIFRESWTACSLIRTHSRRVTKIMTKIIMLAMMTSTYKEYNLHFFGKIITRKEALDNLFLFTTLMTYWMHDNQA